jgi:hypothetical protein
MIHNNYLYFLKLESYHLLKYVRYHHGLYEYEDSRKEKYLLARKLTEYQRSSITYINAAGVTRTISSLDDRTIHLQQAAV